MNKETPKVTRVYALPSDVTHRKAFLEGIRMLADQYQATQVAGSMHDEITYVEVLERELAEHLGVQGVEKIRLDYESR